MIMGGSGSTVDIKVGILAGEEIRFELHGSFRHVGSNSLFEGKGEARMENGGLVLEFAGKTLRADFPVVFEPLDAEKQVFDLFDVTIGVDFHWQRRETQRFRGSLHIIHDGETLWGVNTLPLEEYLVSVISSEMRASASEAFLKAHAVIARSWLLAQIQKQKGFSGQFKGDDTGAAGQPGEHIRWYDREDHRHFDVCADDHCQRYQGITRVSSPVVAKAVSDTSGLVLMYDGHICDARYSKCCGGLSEHFEHVWEPRAHPYLVKVADNHRLPVGFDTNLDTEDKARAWILGSPEAFCNTRDAEVLSQVLNEYDQETIDFYRWEVILTQEEARRLLRKKIGLDVGHIMEMMPVERGTSGRLIRLKMLGSEGSMVIGKELEIRKALSESHLYSSAFVVEAHDVRQGIPGHFVLKGAGWGHGVGLCQIGAAVMGARGIAWQDILGHYFKGATIEKNY